MCIYRHMYVHAHSVQMCLNVLEHTNVDMYTGTCGHAWPRVCTHIYHTPVRGYTCAHTRVHRGTHIHFIHCPLIQTHEFPQVRNSQHLQVTPYELLPGSGASCAYKGQALTPRSCGRPAAARRKRHLQPVQFSQVRLTRKPLAHRPPAPHSMPLHSLPHPNQESPSEKLLETKINETKYEAQKAQLSGTPWAEAEKKPRNQVIPYQQQ